MDTFGAKVLKGIEYWRSRGFSDSQIWQKFLNDEGFRSEYERRKALSTQYYPNQDPDSAFFSLYNLKPEEVALKVPTPGLPGEPAPLSPAALTLMEGLKIPAAPALTTRAAIKKPEREFEILREAPPPLLKGSRAPPVPLTKKVPIRKPGEWEFELPKTEPVGIIEKAKIMEWLETVLPGGSLLRAQKLGFVKKAYDRLRKDLYASTKEGKLQRAEDVWTVKQHLKEVDEMAKRAERGETLGAQVLGGIAGMAPWIIEFYLTRGVRALGSKAAQKMASRVIPALAKTKGGRVALEAIGLTGASAFMTGALPHRVMAEVLERQIPSKLHFGPNDELVIDIDPESPALSFAKGFGSVFVEALSEQTGEYFGRILRKLPFTGKLLKKIERAWLDLHPDKTAIDFANKIATRAGYNGIFEEMGEERVVTFLHTMIKTEHFGAGEDADRWTRLKAGLNQDIKHLPAEFLTFMAIPAGKFALAKAVSVKAPKGAKITPLKATQKEKKVLASFSTSEWQAITPELIKKTKISRPKFEELLTGLIEKNLLEVRKPEKGPIQYRKVELKFVPLEPEAPEKKAPFVPKTLEELEEELEREKISELKKPKPPEKPEKIEFEAPKEAKIPKPLKAPETKRELIYLAESEKEKEKEKTGFTPSFPAPEQAKLFADYDFKQRYSLEERTKKIILSEAEVEQMVMARLSKIGEEIDRAGREGAKALYREEKGAPNLVTQIYKANIRLSPTPGQYEEFRTSIPKKLWAGHFRNKGREWVPKGEVLGRKLDTAVSEINELFGYNFETGEDLRLALKAEPASPRRITDFEEEARRAVAECYPELIDEMVKLQEQLDNLKPLPVVQEYYVRPAKDLTKYREVGLTEEQKRNFAKRKLKRRQLLAIVHILKEKKNIDDEGYRRLLKRLYKVSSAKTLADKSLKDLADFATALDRIPKVKPGKKLQIPKALKLVASITKETPLLNYRAFSKLKLGEKEGMELKDVATVENHNYLQMLMGEGELPIGDNVEILANLRGIDVYDVETRARGEYVHIRSPIKKSEQQELITLMQDVLKVPKADRMWLITGRMATFDDPQLQAAYQELQAQKTKTRHKALLKAEKILRKKGFGNVMRVLTDLSWHDEAKDVRFVFSKLEERTGLPFYRIYYALSKFKNLKKYELKKMRTLLWKGVERLTPEELRHIDIYNRAVEQHKRPPFELTENEKRFNNNVIEVCRKYKDFIKEYRFKEWLLSKLAGENKGKGITNIPNVTYETLEEGYKIWQEAPPQEKEARIKEWLKKQDFGTVQYYIPRAILTPSTKYQFYDIAALGKRMTKPRQAITDISDLPLTTRVNRYLNNILNLKYLEKPLQELDALVDGLGVAMNPGVARNIYNWTTSLKGYGQQELKIEKGLKTVTRQMFRSITVRPHLWVRNFFQRGLAPFRLPLASPISTFALYKNLPEDVREFFEIHVNQMQSMRKGYLLFADEASIQFPILKECTKFVERIGTIYALTDRWNRSRVFVPTYTYVKKIADKYVKKEISLERLKTRSGYDIMTRSEQEEYIRQLNEGGAKALALYVAKWNTDNSQWLYDPTERSFMEARGGLYRTFFNLFCWPRGLAQHFGRTLTKMKTGTWKEKQKAFQSLMGTICWMAFSEKMLETIFLGKMHIPFSGEKKPKFIGYDILESLLWTPGGVVLGPLTEVIDALRDVVTSYGGSKEQQQRALRKFDYCLMGTSKLAVPFLNQAVNVAEALTDEKYMLPIKTLMGKKKALPIKPEELWTRSSFELILHALFGKVRD